MTRSTLRPLFMQVIPFPGIYEHEVEGVKWNGIYNYEKTCKPEDFCVCVCVLVNQSCPTLCDLVDCSPQAPLFVESSRQEYWSGQPFPSPGDLPNPGIKPGSPALLLWWLR